MGRLERHLDLDLIARVNAGSVFEPKPVKRIRPPRKAETYRGARRNAVLHTKPHGVWPNNSTGRAYAPDVELNRSGHWKYAATYQAARDLSPIPTQPVR